jgi:hypothetical protein
MRARGKLTWPARCYRPVYEHLCSQRCSMRMIYLTQLVLADLPVDLVVVLEQQERADEAKRTERTPPDLRCSSWGEHVFVR